MKFWKFEKMVPIFYLSKDQTEKLLDGLQFFRKIFQENRLLRILWNKSKFHNQNSKILWKYDYEIFIDFLFWKCCKKRQIKGTVQLGAIFRKVTGIRKNRTIFFSQIDISKMAGQKNCKKSCRSFWISTISWKIIKKLEMQKKIGVRFGVGCPIYYVFRKDYEIQQFMIYQSSNFKCMQYLTNFGILNLFFAINWLIYSAYIFASQ